MGACVRCSHAAAVDHVPPLADSDMHCCSVVQAAERQAKLAALLGLGLHIDEEEARYYVQAAGTDLKAAIQLFGEPRR
jgi:hypothetical protein